MSNNEINDSMCVLPWEAVAIRPFSTALPCCRFQPTNEFNNSSTVHTDFRKSKEWTNLRQQMLNGVKLVECQKCYNEESLGKSSFRNNENKIHLKLNKELPTTTEPLKLRFLEVAFSNLCNLACVSCNAWFSSTWAVQDYKQGRLSNKIPKVLVEHNSNIDSLDLSSLDTLKIIGGEPFMDQDRFIDLLEKVNLSKVKLIVSTNGTVLPNARLKSLIDQCNQVLLDVSIDGIGSVNEWYRWPTKSETVEKVMNQYQEWWGENKKFRLRTHTLVNIYNVWTLDEFIKYMNTKYPSWEIDIDWLQEPNWQNISIIPKIEKENLSIKLKNWADTINGNWLRNTTTSPFLSTLYRLSLPSSGKLEDFQTRTIELAKERNLDVFKMVPNIEVLFKK